MIRLTPVEGDTDRFDTQRADGFWASGEPAVFRRGSDGSVEALVLNAMTAWPIDVWRGALASGDLAGALPEASL